MFMLSAVYTASAEIVYYVTKTYLIEIIKIPKLLLVIDGMVTMMMKEFDNNDNRQSSTNVVCLPKIKTSYLPHT